MSGNGNFKDSFSQLNIIPVSISYEYEPCDELKSQELYLSSLHSKYVKAPGEDLNSILIGIKQFKGNIHLSFGKPIQEELIEIEKASNENEKIKLLTAMIDKQIYHSYKLFSTNYIAYDLMHKTNVFESTYTKEEQAKFEEYMKNCIDKLSGEKDALTQILLGIYANPVINKLK
jgi:hypothetical protein